MELSLTEQLLYSTVRIKCEGKVKDEDGKVKVKVGTGYFFEFKKDKGNNCPITVVITNKHLIDGAQKGRLIFSKKDDKGNPLDTEHFSFSIDDFEQAWKRHPDKNVDLCAMPLKPFLNLAEQKGIELFYRTLQMKYIPREQQLDELSAVEDVIMVGYPNGLWDKENNKPLFRKGITATHPKFNYKGKKEFLIDMACFPGSSGSPVFLLNEGSYPNKKTGGLIVGRTRFFILGTLRAGPTYTPNGEIKIVDIPTTQNLDIKLKIPINLGLVIKASRIKELEDLF